MARPSFTTRQSPARPNNRPYQSAPTVSDDWKKRPSIRVYIPWLPEGTTTWEIYQCLAPYGGGQGKIDFIRINESRQGNFSAGATVTFKYVNLPSCPIHLLTRQQATTTLGAMGSSEHRRR